MSVEAYEEMTSSYELYSQIKEGMDDIATGNTRPFSEAMADIRSRRSRWAIRFISHPPQNTILCVLRITSIYPHLRNLFLQVPFLVHTLIKSRTRYNQYKHNFKSQQHICDALTIIETVKMQNRIIYDEVEILSNFHIFAIFCLNLLIFYVILLK